ncbi:MAG: DUF3368 domain-containing protein [Synechococcales cyanobacterium RU_4_20]|nr:DUF3368 domain-containing protein [Synechococcales cyanobacterium RU_4_20]NJR70589.1 DUF3368 domain-containing protein [Synechococcales cyanobacterium CRU_2_2]
MPNKRVVINASPLIVLLKSQQTELLPQLFSEILVPRGVLEEVLAGGPDDRAVLGLPEVAWANVIDMDGGVAPEVAAWDLGKGESEVLSLAGTTSGSVAIVDDRAARRCGSSLGIPTLGTGGVLVLAKRRGLITDVSSRLQALQDVGLWMSVGLVEILKEQAGE